MYSVGVWHEYEWEYEMSPAWRFVGFNKEVEDLGREYVRRTLGLGEGEDVPEVSYASAI